MILSVVDGDGDDVRCRRDIQFGEVRREVGGPKAATELDDADALAGTGRPSREVVKTGQLDGSK
jgi:hypothetical protein